MIPKIIHQTWKTSDVPKKWKEYHNTWKKYFPEPEYKHILWTDKDNREFIKNNYNWFFETFNNYPKGIQKADAIRYFILFHYGGIYADLDCEVRENFYQDLDQDNINLAGNPYGDENSSMNNLMCSNKNNQKWKKVFQELEKRKNNLSTLESTGPNVLGVLKNQDVNVLDYREFNPLKKRNFLRYHLENTFFVTLDREKMKTWDTAKVVHHGSESWVYDEVKHLLYSNIFLILLIILLIAAIIYYKKYLLRN